MSYVVFATLKGSFGSIHGELVIDEAHPDRSVVNASIEVGTLTTGNRLRDAHLRSGDFFDVDRFPEITYESRHVERTVGSQFHVVGALTIRETMKEVELEAEYEEEAGRHWRSARPLQGHHQPESKGFRARSARPTRN